MCRLAIAETWSRSLVLCAVCLNCGGAILLCLMLQTRWSTRCEGMNNLRFFVVCSRRFNCGRSVDALTQQVDTGDVNATTADFVLLLPHSFVTLMRRMMMLLSYHCVIFLSFWQKRFLIWGSKMGGSGETVFHDKGHDQFQEAGGKRSFNTTNELLTLKHMKRFLGI